MVKTFHKSLILSNEQPKTIIQRINKKNLLSVFLSYRRARWNLHERRTYETARVR